MTTFSPRPPYSREELDRLYPQDLELQLVQVILRHGERSPVSARFQNAGLPAYWPYCHAAQRMKSVVMTPSANQGWTPLEWRRRLERFGDGDSPVVASGPGGEIDGICQMGELTDQGRQTTYDLGARLRHLYVDQVGFMPSYLDSVDSIWLRATHMPRALESVQQTYMGMYPPSARAPNLSPPTILTRTPADETLYPNEGNCRRFAQLARAFAQRAAERWNDTPEMDYLNQKLGKWMPESSPKIAVDSHPRLSGFLDTINSTRAHGKETRLSKEFYDDKVIKTVDKIVTEEWFAGYMENREYRQLGIGALAGDIVERMTSKVQQSGLSVSEIGGQSNEPGKRLGRDGEKSIKFGMSGCHDTTLAGLLAALGAFEGEDWPPYTSHIAFELFKTKGVATPPATESTQTVQPGFISSMLGLFSSASSSKPTGGSHVGREAYATLTPNQQSKLQNHYVRMRFNDRPMTVPACKLPGNHYEDDESLCTFEAFKRVVDGFTPKDWKEQCRGNLGGDIVGVNREGKQAAGVIEEGM